MEDLPEGLFRNAIDLNRFSNGTSKKLINSYNRIILKAVAELKRIEAMPSAKRPKVRAARLRALLAQTKSSLNTWSVKSVNELAKDLEGIAQIQSDFATQQISKALSPSAKQLLSVNSVEVTPSFAKAVVNADPLDISTNVLSQSLDDAVRGATGNFKLTATQGSQIRMPGGESITKLFRGLAEKNAELFATNVQDGLLTGETTQQIARRLVGNLDFGQKAMSARQLAMAGGESTKMANHQIMAITRTSINQVANKASQEVYKSNSDLTSKYRYVATLDSRTSPICRELDGKEFIYGKGPEPAQHFNCRSTTVAVIDYDKIQEKHPNVKPPSKPLGKRAAAGGSVPSNTTYGKWLQKQPASVKAKTLGKEKAKYFDRLSKKYGPDEAMKKFVRDDGSEVSLKTFKARYGKPENIKKTTKKSTKTTPAPVQNKYIKKFKKQSDDIFEEEYEFNKGRLEVNKIAAAQKIRTSKSTNVINKAKMQLKESEEGLKYLEKRHISIKEKWRKDNLPSTPKTKALKKLETKQMGASLTKYEKELSIREKALNPKDPLYEKKLEVIRDQQFDIEKMRKRLKAGLPVNDFDNPTPLGYIYDRQGFNAKPTRVKTFEELNKSKELLKGGNGENLILYRGVTEKEFALQFKGIGKDGGQHFPGSGIYGSGTYAASRNFHSTGKAAIAQTKRARGTAEAYANNLPWVKGKPKKLSLVQKKERVTAFGFKKDARVVTWKQKDMDIWEGASREWTEWEEMIHERAGKLTGLTFDTTGEAAAALGIDAYQVPNAGGIEGLDEDYWVILNRGALVVSDEAGY